MSALDGMVTETRAPAQGALFEAPETGALGGPETGISERRRGRPEGARGRATEDRRKFYLTRYADPLEGAIAWALPADLIAGVIRAQALAKIVGCKTLEMLEFMRKAGTDAMPYLHSKAVDLTVNGKVAHAHIGLGGPPAPGAATSEGIAQLRAFLDGGLAELDADERQLIEGFATEIPASESVEKTDTYQNAADESRTPEVARAEQAIE